MACCVCCSFCAGGLASGTGSTGCTISCTATVMAGHLPVEAGEAETPATGLLEGSSMLPRYGKWRDRVAVPPFPLNVPSSCRRLAQQGEHVLRYRVRLGDHRGASL